jgi:HD-GYP domain-containing protein (c-di-GMP phosphodiesterase class II)
MLKRIDPCDVTMGMYIHKLEGSWLNHPFWRARFLLTDAVKLGKLRRAAIPGLIIDTAKGRDVDSVPADTPIQSPASPRGRPAWQAQVEHPAPRRNMASSNGPPSVAREFGRAARVADRGTKVVSKVFFEMRLGKAIEVAAITPVIDDIFASIQRNPHAFNGLMQCKRDTEYIYRHALAVSALMISLGREMKLPPHQLRQAGLAGMLLDSGVSQLPVDLADYGGDHRQLPQDISAEHVQLGHRFILNSRMASEVAVACLEHHERMDGTGFPDGKSGASLSLFGRMAAICDTYDTLADGGGGMDPAVVLDKMAQDVGAFDPEIMKSFINAMGTYPIGTVVELRSGRLAMVIDQSASDLALPKVRAFYSLALAKPVTPEVIDLAHCYGADSIARIADAAASDLPDFARAKVRMLALITKG